MFLSTSSNSLPLILQTLRELQAVGREGKCWSQLAGTTAGQWRESGVQKPAQIGICMFLVLYPPLSTRVSPKWDGSQSLMWFMLDCEHRKTADRAAGKAPGAAAGALPAAHSWLREKKAKKFSRLNGNNGRSCLRSLRLDGCAHSKLPQKSLAVISAQQQEPRGVCRWGPAWIRLCPIFLQGKGTQIPAQGSARSHWAMGKGHPWVPCPDPSSACSHQTQSSHCWGQRAPKAQEKTSAEPKFWMGAEAERGAGSWQYSRMIGIIHTLCSAKFWCSARILSSLWLWLKARAAARKSFNSSVPCKFSISTQVKSFKAHSTKIK